MATKNVSRGYRGYTIDYKQAVKVFKLAVEARLALVYPYDKPPVQRKENWPEGMEWGSLSHARLLFISCLYQKGGIDSETSIKQISRLAVRYPNLFEPEYFLKIREESLAEFISDLVEILDRFGLGSNANDAARAWVYNMQKLALYWKSDPRLLFKAITEDVAARTWKSYKFAQKNYGQLCERIMRQPGTNHDNLMSEPKGFYGFRHKMVSMLAYFYVDAGICPRFAYAPPIDFHLIRFLCATQIVRLNILEPGSFVYTERVLPGARDVTFWYVVKTGISTEEFAEAMWVLSRELCKRTPGNKCTVDKVRRARARVIYEHPVVWSGNQIRRYDRTCGVCPVETECRWNIPSAYYYVKGGVKLSKRRAKPPQLSFLRLDEVPVVRSTNGHKLISELPILDTHQLQMFE